MVEMRPRSARKSGSTVGGDDPATGPERRCRHA